MFPVWIEGIPSLGVFLSIMQKIIAEKNPGERVSLSKQNLTFLEGSYIKISSVSDGCVGLRVLNEYNTTLFAEKANEEALRTEQKEEIIKKGGRVYDYKTYLAFHRNQLIRPRLTKERSECDANGSNTN